MRLTPAVVLLAVAACTQSPAPAPLSPPGSRGVGVLVMAHGGGGDWNAAVAEAVASVAATAPTALAFGMADPTTLAAGLDSLRARGVGRVAVVRLFVSGASFLEQTEYLLGLSDVRPRFFVHHGSMGGDHGSAGNTHEPAPIAHGMDVATHPTGLVDGTAIQTILVDRAGEISEDPSNESVLVLAHGMGDPGDNAALIAGMERTKPALREAGFASTRMEALREDWPEARQEAEMRIRDFVEDQTAQGRDVIVLPLRVSGFGPYEEVLQGLSYRKGEGLLPHPEVGRWLQETASALICRQGWTDPWAACPTLTTPNGQASPPS